MNKVLSHHTSSFSKVPRTNSRHTEFLSGPWSCIVYFYCQAFYLACISFWNVLWFFSSHGYLLLAIHSQCHLLRDNFSDDPIQKSWGHSSNCANSPPVLISICHDSWFFNDFFFCHSHQLESKFHENRTQALKFTSVSLGPTTFLWRCNEISINTERRSKLLDENIVTLIMHHWQQIRKLIQVYSF